LKARKIIPWALCLSFFSSFSSFSSAARGGESLPRFFQKALPDSGVVCTASADLDGDGREDLIVIYSIAPEVNRMCAVLNPADGPRLTNEHPAPVSDQVIQLRDIDEKPPTEFIVFGRKGLNAGFAIYRYERGNLEDLFGEGMHECCN
jgi:hypothetical protein